MQKIMKFIFHTEYSLTEVKLWSAEQGKSIGHCSSYAGLKNGAQAVSRQMNLISMGIPGLEKAQLIGLV